MKSEIQPIVHDETNEEELFFNFQMPVFALNEAEEMSSEEELDLIHKIRQRYWKLQNVTLPRV